MLTIPLLLIFIIFLIVTISFVFINSSKSKHYTLSNSSKSKYTLSNSLLYTLSFPLKLKTLELSCNTSLKPLELVTTLPIIVDNIEYKYEVSLHMDSNNLLIYSDNQLGKHSNFELRNINGQLNIYKQMNCYLNNMNIGVGFIQSGTIPSWCENVLGLLPPVYERETGLELINWKHIKNFSLDLRNTNNMIFTINDKEIPSIKLDRIFQSKTSKDKMIPGDYYTIKIDSFKLDNGKDSGPFYYILDISSDVDIIPKNLTPWLNYQKSNVIYQIGGKDLIHTHMNNIIYRENYLIDQNGYILHAGLLGLNSMIGFKWIFSEYSIGIIE